METIQEEWKRLKAEAAELRCRQLAIRIRLMELKKEEESKKKKNQNTPCTPKKKKRKKKDEEIDNNDSMISSEKTKIKTADKQFVKPTLEEVQAYMDSRGEDRFKAVYFWNYYEGRNWKIGYRNMTNWRVILNNWIERENKAPKRKGKAEKPQQNVVTFNAYKPVERKGTVSYEEYLRMKNQPHPYPPEEGLSITNNR